MSVTLPALRANQNHHVMFLVSIPAKTLSELNLKVERFQPTLVEQLCRDLITKDEFLDQQGYQRPVDNNRANRFARYLEREDAISPTVLLINDRDGSCSYNEKTGKLTIDSEIALYIYDGQHRKAGIDKALKEKADLADFSILCVITSQLPKMMEMTQFEIINDTQIGVKTNLVIEIKTLVQTGEVEADKDVKEISCNHAIHFLNHREDSPLQDMIILASTVKPKRREIKDNPELARQRFIPSAPFMRSLKDIHDYFDINMWPGVPNGTLKTPTSLENRGKKMADVVIEFWNAVKSQMPETFEHPADYLLLSPNGVQAMHRVLVRLLGDMHRGRREWTEPEFVTMTSDSEWFTDQTQWERVNGEASGYAAGIPGMEKLAATIIESLNSAVPAN